MNIGEPYDVLNAKSWEDLAPSRYLQLKAEAKKSAVTSAEDNYAIALENELKTMDKLLNGVSDKELEKYDSEKMKKYLQALENFSQNEKISDTNGTLLNDTFYVNTKNNIDRIKEKYSDKLSDDQKEQLDKIEENSGNNAQEDYDKWVEDQKPESELMTDEDIWDGGIDSLFDLGGGVLFNPVFDFFLLLGDSVNTILQKIMLADESDGFIDNLLIKKIKDFVTNTFDIMSKESKDEIFEDAGEGNANIKVKITTTIGTAEFPHIYYSCEEIFAGKIGLLNINFISGDGQSESLGTVRAVISSWYKTLRLIAIVGLLSALIYTGIRIMISTTAQEKSKYKEWLIGWIIGIALLFSLHYIMSLITTIIDKFCSLLSMSMQNINVTYQVNNDLGIKAKGGVFSTNLIGLVRFLAQSSVPSFKMGYLILYILLTSYTIKFTIVYLKRLINMAFLTLIAPIIAFTYPLDKLADGQAQGFNAWLKEYIYNALLQPLHLILYASFVGASVKIAATNPIYALAVLMFMAEAEKLLKKIFGIDKGDGLGTIKGMQDAVVGATMAKQMTGMLSRGKGKVEKNEIQSQSPINTDYQNVGLDMGSSEGIPAPNPEPSDNREKIVEPERSQEREDIPPRRNGPPRLKGIKPKKSKKQTLPIHELAEKIRKSKSGQTAKKIANMKAGRAVASASSRIIRPIWDTRKDASWNGKRLIRKIAGGAAGVAVGTAVAAVQAGISLTDGNYNILEGFTSFGTGYAFARNKVNNLVNTFEEGYDENLSNKNLSEEEKEEKIRKYKANFINRDDVIEFCQKNYGNRWREYRERMAEMFVTRGITDLKEMKEMMKYSEKATKDIANGEQLSDEKIKEIQYEQDIMAIKIKEMKKRKEKERTSKSIYDLDAENNEILAKTAGMDKESAQKLAKEIRDINSAIRYYNDKING